MLEEYRDGRAPEGRSCLFGLAGAQAKTALCLTADGQWAAPRGSTPSTHILKPVSGDFRRIDVVEHLTMKAAAHLGLDVAETWLEDFGPVQAFVTTPYDRRVEDGRWRRLHQEDLCQALSVPPAKKYQHEDGGPGVAEAGHCLLACRKPPTVPPWRRRSTGGWSSMSHSSAPMPTTRTSPSCWTGPV
ncbi:HipA domain-containing protein [Arthrobacter sp. JSM 101049]|uniref:HipA domain-containing protein n=1 Tax=Arthrobacter sp. JSM 101049 TaxID=929097 RepID=UPI0035628724